MANLSTISIKDYFAMKIMLLILALMCSSASAIPYQPHSIEQLKTLFNLNKEGNKYYASTNLSALLAITEVLETHALEYPVSFDNDADKTRAQKEVRFLSNMLNQFFPEMNQNKTFLMITLRINNVAYNLDVQLSDSKSRIKKSAQAIFALDPKDCETHFRFGAFLASSGSVVEGISHLEFAVTQDYIPAYFMLAIAYIMNGENQKAVNILEIYKTKVPDDRNIDDVLEAIRNGHFEVY